jgi:effector-binding domain-containing protein
MAKQHEITSLRVKPDEVAESAAEWRGLMSRLRIVFVAALAAFFTSAATAQPVPQSAMPQSSVKSIEPQEVTLAPQKVVYISGHADFDDVYNALVTSLRELRAYLDKEGIAPTGPAMARYTDGGENGFEFEVAYPVAETPKNPPQGDIAAGDVPGGKALDFVHRGSFNKIDETYSAIDDYFRERGKPSAGGPEADEEHDVLADSFEQYTTDPLTTDPNQVEVHIIVPVKQ